MVDGFCNGLCLLVCFSSIKGAHFESLYMYIHVRIEVIVSNNELVLERETINTGFVLAREMQYKDENQSYNSIEELKRI